MYVYKNKESGLYLVLSVSEMVFFDGLDDYLICWYISETDEISCASKFDEPESLLIKEDSLPGFNIDDWKAECVEL